ncbi:beta strand repeat-containing protein [Spirosoma litoris]
MTRFYLFPAWFGYQVFFSTHQRTKAARYPLLFSAQPNFRRWFTLLLISLPLLAVAQGPSLLWQKVLGGTAYERFQSITASPDGGYVVAGYTASTDGDVSGGHGNNDYWVVKLDAAGNLLWQKTFGGTGDDRATAITASPDGGYVVAGYTASTNGIVTGNHGGDDYWIVKLDASGNLLWQKTFGGTQDDQANAITASSDGGYVVAGQAMSRNGDVSGNHGLDDYWIIKLDASGNLLWQKTLGGTSTDQANAITASSDGGYVVAGQAMSRNGDVSGGHGSYDYWIVKLDASGNLLWQKAFGGTQDDFAQAITGSPDGGYVVTGELRSTDEDVVGNHGGFDAWVIKLDASGNLLWQKALGGTGNDYNQAITTSLDGGYTVAGYSQSTNGDASGNHGSMDCWVVKLDAAGNLLWQKMLGGTGWDTAQTLLRTPDGELVVAGVTGSDNGDVSGGYSGDDTWVFKLGLPPTISGLAVNSSTICPDDVVTFTATVGDVTGSYGYTLTNGSTTINGTTSSLAFSQTLVISDSGSQSFSLVVSTTGGFSVAVKALTVGHPDYQPLVDFYNSTNGAGWTTKTNWLTGCDPCSWYGVGCTNGRVTTLLLSYNQLSGPIPESLANLTNLQYLDLQGNQLTDGIPASFSALTSLTYLRLTNNPLGGEIPAGLGKLTSLTYLELVNNQLSGEIPTSLSALANLTTLNLGVNGLQGEIPVGLGALTNLKTLNLVYNRLSGPVPASVSNLTKLESLGLQYNYLSGCYPSSLTALCGVINNSFYNNDGLPGGGSQAAFNTFCATGQGSDAFVPTATANSSTATVGDVVSLSTSGGSSYNWTAPTGVLLSNTNSNVVSATLTATGVKTFTVVVGQGGSCNQTATVSVTATAVLPTISGFAGTSGTVCAGNVTTFTATVGNLVGNYSYTLTSGNNQTSGTSSSSVFSQTLVVSGSGDPSVSLVVISNNQSASATTTVTIDSKPTLSINPTSTTLTAANPTASLTAIGTGTFIWSTGTASPAISVTSSGTYSVTLTSPSGCTASASVPVIGSDLTINLDLPQANFGLTGATAIGNFVVNVFEVGGLPTSSGNVRITVTAPIGYTLAFPPSLTTIQVSGGSAKSVNNAQWTVLTNLANRQITLMMTSGTFIGAGGESSLGFILTRTNASSGSTSSITVNVVDDLTREYDGNLLNNGYARIITGL